MRKSMSRLAAVGLVLPLMACAGSVSNILKIKDTVFSPALADAEVHSLKSLTNINFKTNDLKVAEFAGTWKNRAGQKEGLLKINKKRQSGSDITLSSAKGGTWTMSCISETKSLGLGGISFDRGNTEDYKCTLDGGKNGKATLVIEPLAKPKFGLSVGRGVEKRTGTVTIAGRGELKLTSLHNFEGSKMESPKAYGYEISRDGQVIGAVGTKNEKRALLIGKAAAEDRSIVVLAGVALRLYMTNDEALTR